MHSIQRVIGWICVLATTVACSADPVGHRIDSGPRMDASADAGVLDAGPPDTMSPDSPVPPPPPRDLGPPDVCGDGRRSGSEACDDRNTMAEDGCSDTCAIEPGYACPVEGEACIALEVCGDGERTESEACDDRNTDASDGCSATCTVEPGWACAIAGIACTAAACGDGIVAGFEDCDDGVTPPVGSDGCSETCVLEDGFACDAPGVPCRATTCGDGVTEGTEPCDDANDDLGDGCNPSCEREPVCADGLCATACGDGVVLPGEPCDDGNTRDGDGCSSDCAVEDGFACTLTRLDDPPELVLPIVYRDFRGRDLAGGHLDFEWDGGDDRGIVADAMGADAKPVYARGDAGGSPTTNGRSWFDSWYRTVAGTNIAVVETITLPRQLDGTYVFDDGDFFPLDGRGFIATGEESPRDGGHNFHFTSEVRYWFEYEGDETLSFRGDDDVWVFINRRLALDIGGVHGAEDASITLDAGQAARLGLAAGGIYEVAVFQAERHTSQSSYRLTLSNFTASITACEPVCGDGIVTRFEVCDDGIDDGRYGGCNPGCLSRGPRCGDGVLQSAEGEQCDVPPNVGGYDGCESTCRLGPHCGDGIVQRPPEECDDMNSVDDDTCSNACRSNIM